MKVISAEDISRAVCELFLEANYDIAPDIEEAIRAAARREHMPAAVNALDQIAQSYAIARRDKLAICQDTGMAVLFAEIGQDVHIQGDFAEAVHEGVRKAYAEGYLRASVVKDPLFDRSNTKDNTPAVIHTELVPGDSLALTAVPKGFGSENCSKARMFAPFNTLEEIRDFVLDVIAQAGPNTCPPSIVGVGIGGTLEKAALLAKKAICRPVGEHHPDANYARLEREWLEGANRLGIGPGGLGGRATALAVNIDTYPTHIASIPVVVNMCCHAARHARRVL